MKITRTIMEVKLNKVNSYQLILILDSYHQLPLVIDIFIII